MFIGNTTIYCSVQFYNRKYNNAFKLEDLKLSFILLLTSIHFETPTSFYRVRSFKTNMIGGENRMSVDEYSLVTN